VYRTNGTIAYLFGFFFFVAVLRAAALAAGRAAGFAADRGAAFFTGFWPLPEPAGFAAGALAAGRAGLGGGAGLDAEGRRADAVGS
jgi:hypothetical protein